MHATLLELFTVLLSLQAVLIVTHDLVDIRGWAHGSQVRAVVGRRKFWLGTLSTAVFPSVAFYFVLRFWRGPVPDYVTTYWWIYCAVTVISAIAMWWLPYFFGAKEETKRMYATMYAGTIQVLPARGDNPRPNLLHLFFHALFALNLALALWLKFGAARL
jgi:hypothetical protein